MRDIKKYMSAVLLLSCLVLFGSSARLVLATPGDKVAPPEASNHLIGKAAIRWAIPKSYWMNTKQPVWLGNLQGNITVIEFFRINCSHCEEAAPSRRVLYLKYRERGLKMVGFQSPGVIDDPRNVENNWGHVKRTVANWRIPYPVAFDKDRVLFGKYGLSLYPTVLVLDRKGIIRFQQIGNSPGKQKELEKFIIQSLSKPVDSAR